MHRVLSLALVLAACTSPPAPAGRDETTAEAAPAATGSSERAATAAAAAPAAAPAAPGGACVDDRGCGFADPCLPRRCVRTAAPADPVVCDKSFPAEGSCVCLA